MIVLQDIFRNDIKYCKIVGVRPSVYLTENFMEKYELFCCYTLHKYTSEGLHATVQIFLIPNPEYDTINT
jgi:hypothetical protein